MPHKRPVIEGLPRKEFADKISREYLAGSSLISLARTYKSVSQSTIREILIEAGIELRKTGPNYGAMIHLDRTFTETQMADIVAAYLAGQPIRSLAKTYGYDKRTITQLLRNLGVTIRNHKEATAMATKLYQERMER